MAHPHENRNDDDTVDHGPDRAAGSPRSTPTAHATEAPRRSESRHASHHDDTHVRHVDESPGRDSFLGTDHGYRATNASWGAIFAGVFMFFAVMLVLGLVSAGLGLAEADGIAVGIWSAIALIISLGIAGFVAGALAVRAGLLHGLVTWAASLVGLLVLVGWLGAGLLGAVGGAIGGVTQTAASVTETNTTEIAETAEDVDQQEVENTAESAAEDAGQQFEESQDDLAAATWWTVGGLVLGAIVTGLAGAAGARTAHTKRTEVRTRA